MIFKLNTKYLLKSVARFCYLFSFFIFPIKIYRCRNAIRWIYDTHCEVTSTAKNINKISDEIGKKLETFNNSVTAYNKAKDSTGIATISINPNKTKATGAATISINPRNTSRPNASVEDDRSSSSQGCQEEATDMRKGKRKRVTNFNTNSKVVREQVKFIHR